MYKTIKKNNDNGSNQVLKTFDIQDKCMELEAIVANKGFNLFKGASVVVAVPTMDESHRYIRKDDFQLFEKQRKDAIDTALYLTENDAHFIEIIKDINTEIDECLNRIIELLDGIKLDYLICLHEFTETEKAFIIQSLNEETGSTLTTIELY